MSVEQANDTVHWPCTAGGTRLLYEVMIAGLGIQGGRIDGSLREEVVDVFRVVLGVEHISVHVGYRRRELHGLDVTAQRQRIQLDLVSRCLANQTALNRIAEAARGCVEGKR